MMFKTLCTLLALGINTDTTKDVWKKGDKPIAADQDRKNSKPKMGYSYYCRLCQVYYNCTHDDPEKVIGKCPECWGKLNLLFSSFEQTKKELGLSNKEIGFKEVIY